MPCHACRLYGVYPSTYSERAEGPAEVVWCGRADVSTGGGQPSTSYTEGMHVTLAIVAAIALFVLAVLVARLSLWINGARTTPSRKHRQ